MAEFFRDFSGIIHRRGDFVADRFADAHAYSEFEIISFTQRHWG
jgi:hypothetical protein